MDSSLAALDALIADAREGSITLSPRARVLRALHALARDASEHEPDFSFGCVPTSGERHALQVQNMVLKMVRKCERMDACLLCTLNPCICSQLPPLALSHRVWMLTHCKEVLRTTATGKLLLLAHPRAELLVSGLPAHEAKLAEVVRRPSAVVLFPADDAISPRRLLDRVAREGAAKAAGGGGAPSRGRDLELDIILLDGTWNQARQMNRTIPSDVPRVALPSTHQRSLFGVRVRKQGAEREALGRSSTVEAFAQLALSLGEEPHLVDAVGGYLDRFILALPYHRPSAYDQSAELPARTPSGHPQRRARSLAHSLGLGTFSAAGRAAVGDSLRARPELLGVQLFWKTTASRPASDAHESGACNKSDSERSGALLRNALGGRCLLGVCLFFISSCV